MVTISRLLADFAHRGIRLIAEPPKLIVKPASCLTDQDCEFLRTHKAEILTILSLESSPAKFQDSPLSDRDGPDGRVDSAATSSSPSGISPGIISEIARIEPVALVLVGVANASGILSFGRIHRNTLAALSLC
jgi:hypothetical protein